MDSTQVLCDVCPKNCKLRPGQIGFCRARANSQGKIIPLNYGRATSLALDPIEKKPLNRYYPGTYILSYGSFGCNFRCPYCQNSQISMAGQEIPSQIATPEKLVELAVRLSKQAPGNLGVAFTYNEPLICYEYIRDCSILLHENSLKSVVVTNGSISEKYARELLPHVDALNIDLKGFTDDFYHYVKGELDTTKNFIKEAFNQGCHIELTTLVIPTKNDDEAQMHEQAKWIASMSEDIPLHLSRFFPRYKVDNLPMTPVQTLTNLQKIAQNYLNYVYIGNV